MKNKIVVVEYEPRYVKRITEALEGESLTFSLAKDGEEGWAVIEKEIPDVVLMSAVLPKLRSAEIIQRLRTGPQFKKTRIILMLTGVNDQNLEEEAEKRHVDLLLPKPFSMERVKECMVSLDKEEAEDRDTMLIVSPEEIEEETRGSEDDMLKGVEEDDSSFSSKDLFGEVVDDSSEHPEQPSPAPPEPPKSAATPTAAPPAEPKPKAKPRPTNVDTLLEKTLTDIKPPLRKTGAVKPNTDAGDLQKRLTETLAGLEIAPQPKKKEPVEPPAAEKPAQPPARDEEPVQEAQPPTPSESKTPVEKPTTPAQPEGAVEKPEEKPPVQKAEEKIETPEKPESETSAKPKKKAATKKEEKEKPTAEAAGEEKDEEIFGQYVLTDKIATGGMAEVYRARMKGVEGFEKVVAIKKILPHLSQNKEFTTMFIDEAKVAAQLSHRNIVHIYDLGKIKDSYFIAMEHVEGMDLRSTLLNLRKKEITLPLPLALSIASQIASALAYAHDKKDLHGKPLGIVHRDVSPQNVLISREGEVKLIDFGIAKAASKASHTRAGALKGKLQYMSPEQAWGKPLDQRSDLFSLGTVLYEMIAGKPLFSGDSEISILEKVRNPEYKSLAKSNKAIPSEVDDLLGKVFNRNPEDRFANAEAMKVAIDAILDGVRPQPSAKHFAQLVSFASDEIEKIQWPSFTFPSRKETPKKAEKPKEKEEGRKEKKPASAAQKKGKSAPSPTQKKKKEKDAGKEKAASAPLKKPEGKPASHLIETLEKESGKKKPPLLWIGIAVAVVIVIVAVLMLSGGKEKPAPEPAQKPPTTAPAPVQQPKPPVETPPEQPEPQKPQVTKPKPNKPKAKPKPKPQVEKPKPQAPKEQPKVEPTPPPAAPPEVKPEPEPTQPPVTTPPVAAPEPKPEPKPVEKPKPKPEPAVEQPLPPQYKAGDLVPIGTDGLMAPNVIKKPAPIYPRIAKARNIEGLIIVRVLVGAKGKVESAKALTKKPLITEAALRAAKRAKFKPATYHGMKVKTYFTLTYNFKLH